MIRWGPLALVGLAACVPNSPDERFRAEVAPILERRCAALACHGVLDGATAGLDLHPETYLTLTVDARGAIVDLAGARASVEAKLSADGVEHSSLLRKTLPLAQGGLLHFQSPVFESRAHPDYQALLAYAEVADRREHADEPPLDPLEAHFAERVYPILVRKGCTLAACHGELNFGGAVFGAPPDPARPALSRSELRRARREARSNLAPFGDPTGARLIRKIVPFESGGIFHKGGNDLFFAAEVEAGRDPRESDDVLAIAIWAELERQSALRVVLDEVEEPPLLPPIVFVGGPLAPGGPFEPSGFVPGTDLYRLDPPYTGAPVNLTAGLHDAPVDLRDPAVSHDARFLAFSMRRAQGDAHNLYVMRVDGTGLRALTDDRAGDGPIPIAHRAPVFGPTDGTRLATSRDPERLYFVSTRDREQSDRADVPNAELYAIDLDGAGLERLTYTPVAEAAPSFVATGEFHGTIVYTLQRAVTGGLRGALFRFPIDHDPAHHLQPEAHPHFGMVGPADVFYGVRELPDGRAALTLFDAGNVWRGGQLAILDRQLAVDLPAGTEAAASVPGFAHALAILTPGVARSGPSEEGLWRDPAPLPDGSLVAVHAEGPLDLDDPSASPRTTLVRLRLQESRERRGPILERVERLAPGLVASQPVALAPRPLEDEPHPRAWSSDDAAATLVHSGLTTIEALLARLPPSGPRALRADLARLRLLAPVPGLRPRPVAPADTRSGRAGATDLSLTGRTPLFALAELEVEPDGSLLAALPPRQPFRLETLGPDGLAVGAPHHHWSAPVAGERFPIGIAPLAFSVRCAGCHGAMSGAPGDVLGPPVDLVTQASVTAARFIDHDRRRPRPPVEVGDDAARYVDFRRDLGPVLAAKCAGCHPGPGTALSLTEAPSGPYVDAYESLLATDAGGFRYVDALGQRAERSPLIERLYGRELAAPAPLGGVCPPPGAPPLTDDERRLFARWIELGAAFVGRPPEVE